MDAPPHNLLPRYNVCPTDPVDVVTAERQLVAMRWGLANWGWRPSTHELRRSKPSRSSATSFKRTRCLIPMSGYYEWQNPPGGKQPWYFTAADGSPLLTAAGLWDEWKNRETGERLKSCSMIITEPSPSYAREA
jgi:putative SOS response-associated peptidase YedK